MEKLVRRHFWMDPVHLACRPGPIVATLLLSLVAFSETSAQSVGHPAKSVRTHSLQRVVDETVVKTIRVTDTPGAVESAVDFVSASSNESAPVVPAPASVPARTTETARAVSREITLTTGPYLPVTGALPLRFAAASVWPSSMPPTQPAAEKDLSELAVNSDLRDVDPAEAATIVANESESDEPVAATVAAREDPAPVKQMPEPLILTADMVLGYLGNLPTTNERVIVNFEPAIPPTLATSSDPLSR